MNKPHQLFESFQKPGKQEWNKAAAAEINGGDPSENLKWTTTDEQNFSPYYSPEDIASLSYLQKFQLNGKSPFSADPRAWANMPLVVINDEESANGVALKHLELEAEGILFSSNSNKINFQKLLKGVAWEHCSVSFFAQAHFPITELINYISDQNFSYGKLQGAIFWEEDPRVPPALPSQNGLRFAGIKIARSSPVEEIATALSRGVEVIEQFSKAGHKVEEIFKHIAFSLPIGSQLLLEVSKLKALRVLWFQVARAYGQQSFQPGQIYVHGYSDKWINEKFQPHGNLLKSTMAAIAAISGGADSLTIEPEELDHSMMTRIARNTSVILKDESQLGKVRDPFAGAYSTEVMTDQIARAAWAKFQAKQ